MWTIYLGIYVFLAVITTLMARLKNVTRGLGYITVFLVSLLFTPVPVFVVLLVMSPRHLPPETTE